MHKKKKYRVYLTVEYVGKSQNKKELYKVITKLKKLPSTFDAFSFSFKRDKVKFDGWDEEIESEG